MKLIMKKFIIALMAVCVSASAFAQKEGHKGGSSWETMQSVKIGFITTEVGLTPEEAQAFWPVYNQAEEEMKAAMKEVVKAQKAMEKAVEGKDAKADYDSLVNAYVKAVSERDAIQGKYVAKFRKTLSAEKLAKYYLAEEKFRRDQIRQLQGMGPGRKGPQGPDRQGGKPSDRQPGQGGPQPKPQAQPEK